MTTRVQVIVDAGEREAFRRAARREGLSLSDWMRRAARQQLQAQGETAIRDVASLRAFFASCDAREVGVEPDREVHRAVIDQSRATGKAPT